MILSHCIDRLTANAVVIESLTAGVSEEQSHWRPDPDSWSILEVINHLTDEEQEDFRRHLDDLLHHPEKKWSAIAPQGWVNERDYNARNLVPSLQAFHTARAESLQWLHGLEKADWDKETETPFGKIQAGEILVSWCAHDLLHIRQLTELHWAWGAQQAEPYSVAYAGPW